jgi:hypothetical protein
MNAKKAKALRKLLKYHPSDKDAFDPKEVYRNHPTDVHYEIPIIDIRDGKPTVIGTKPGVMPGHITECVYGPYKEYKMLKKLAKNPNYDARLTILPSREEEAKLAEKIRLQGVTNGESNSEISSGTEENLRCNSEGGLQGSDDLVRSEAIEE